MGHCANAIDLPSHGDDPTPPDEVTLADYVAATTDAMSADTILVGHSLGGLTITLAAAAAPEKTRALVYLCAFVPPSGIVFGDHRKGAVSPAVAEFNRREGNLSIPIPDLAGDMFYHDCPPDDRAYAESRLSPQPLGPLSEELNFRAAEVPRHYIRCLNDRVVLPAYQQQVSRDWPPETRHDMDTGHSPFFADPGGLVGILDRIARAL